MRRLVLSAAVLTAAALGLAACGGSSTASSATTPSSSTPTSASPAPTTPATTAATTATTTTASLPTPADLATGDLRSRLAAAPPGFTVSHADGDVDGAITAQDFDSLTDTGAAQELGYVSGEGETFAKGSVQVEYDLLRLSSAANAARFVTGFQGTDPTDTTKPTIGTDPAIPHSVTVVPTVGDPSSQQEYDLFAQVGSGIMVTSLYTSALDPSFPQLLDDLAQLQYATLAE